MEDAHSIAFFNFNAKARIQLIGLSSVNKATMENKKTSTFLQDLQNICTFANSN